MSDRRRTSTTVLHESRKVCADIDLAENFLEALDAIYTEDLTEAVDEGRLETTYKGYKIYSRSVKTDPGYRNAQGVHEPYRQEYYYVDSKGIYGGSGSADVEECKKAVDLAISEKSADDRRTKAKELAGTKAETYRGINIFYKDVVDADANPPEYSYEIMATTRLGRAMSSDLEKKTFLSVDEAKKAIDACIRDWNIDADDDTKYKESLRRLIREALSILEAKE